MKKVRHREAQIRHKLQHAQKALAEGASVLEVCRELSISEATYHRWRNRYGNSHPHAVRPASAKDDFSRRSKELEKENKCLKHLVGQLMLDNALLKDAMEVRRKK